MPSLQKVRGAYPTWLNNAVAQHLLNEIELSSFFSSPESHTIALVDKLQSAFVERFLAACKKNSRRFDIASATQNLRDLWHTECVMLGDGERYQVARRGRDLGELHPTEADCVLYDSMGHLTLCIINNTPQWKEYVLANHLPAVQTLLQLGSHAARTLLDMEIDIPADPPNLSQIADRFFLGDVTTLTALAKGYRIMI